MNEGMIAWDPRVERFTTRASWRIQESVSREIFEHMLDIPATKVQEPTGI